MRIKLSVLALFISLVLIGTVGLPIATAQEEEYILAHEDIFGSLRRPPVGFSHENHTEWLEDSGCGVCHHTPDDKYGQLAYIEGDERSCKECHGLQKEAGAPALREAFHGNCTNCHRKQIKSGDLKGGPTTCGGCHRKS